MIQTDGARPPGNGSAEARRAAPGSEPRNTRWARLALYVLLGTVGAFTICLLLLFNLDLGRFQGQIEKTLTDALSREFAIEDGLNVEVDLRRIRVAAAGVRLAGTDWSADADLVRIGRIEAVINSWSLIDRPIRIESLVVDGLRIHLQRDESGTGNWALFDPKAVDTTQDDNQPVNGLPVIVDLARIANVTLSYRRPEPLPELSFTATELEVEHDGEDYLGLFLDAALNETPMRVEARTGPFANLVDLRNIDITLAGSLGDIRLDGEAKIDNLLRPQRPTMRLSVSGPSAEYLTEKLKVDSITRGPLDLTASVAPLGDNMQLNLNGDYGEFAIDVSGRFQNLQTLDYLSLRAAASGPNAAAIARLLGNPNVPEDPFSVVANFTRSGPSIDVEEIAVNVGETRFIVNARIIDLSQPARARGTFRIDGPDFGRFNRLIGLPGKLTGPFDMDIDFEPLPDGSATVRLAANAEDLQLIVAGTVADTPDLSGTRLRIDFRGRNFQTVTAALGLADAPPEPFELGIEATRVPEGIDLSDGKMNIGDDRFAFAGLIGNVPLDAGTDLSFEGAGPNLAATLSEFGLDADELPYARYSVGGRIERRQDGFALHDIAVAIGDNLEYALNAEGTVTDRQDLVGTRLQIRLNGVSLGALADAAGVAGMPPAAFQASAKLERLENGFAIEEGRARLGDDTIHINGLIGNKPLERDTEVRFDATVKDLKATLASFGIDAGKVPPGEFSADGEIRSRGSRFLLHDVDASLAGARVSLSGQMGAMPSFDGTDIKLELRGESLARLLPEDENLAKLTDPFRVSANLRVRDDLLSLSDARVDLPGLEASAMLEVGVAPVMGRGRFSIAASSPDVVPLTPRVEGHLTNKLPLRLVSSGRWDAGRFTLDELDLGLGQGVLVGSGTVGGPPNFEGTDLTLELRLASLRNLSALAGRELPDDAAQLNVHLAGSRGVIRLERLEASVGSSDISGNFAYRDADVPEIDITLTSTRLDMSPYLRADTDEPVEEPPATPRKDRVIPDTPIPVDELRRVTASVDVDIKEIDLGAKVLTDVVLVGSLADGVLAVEKFALSNNVGGTLRGNLTLQPVDEGAALVVDVSGSSLILGMSAGTQEELDALPRYALDTILLGSGATTRDLAASLNGYLRLVGGEGRVKPIGLRFFTSDFLSELASTVNPFTKTDAYTTVQCAVALVEFNNGKAAGKPITVLQTDRLRMFVNAKVDLATEKLSADIRTVPQKGLGLSISDLANPYVKLGGTLAKPILTLDPEGALLEGGAAVATGGVSLLAKRFKERFIDEKDACGKAVRDAEPRFAELRAKFRPAASLD